MTSPDKTLFFFFRSVPRDLNEDMWIVKAVLPPNADSGTPMSIEAADGNEKPLESAVFGVAGCKVAISGGKGILPFGDFVKGMNETAVWMFRSGREPVPGSLTFG